MLFNKQVPEQNVLVELRRIFVRILFVHVIKRKFYVKAINDVPKDINWLKSKKIKIQ